MNRYDSIDHTPKSSFLPYILVLIVAIVAGLYFLLPKQGDERQVTEILDVPPTQRIQDNPGAQKLNLGNTDPAGQTGADNKQKLIRDTPPPPLNESDPDFKQDLLGLSESLAPWLQPDQLIQKYVTIFNDTSQGVRPNKHFRYFTIDKPFTVGQDEQGLYIDPKSYRRFDSLVKAIDALDIQQSMDLYNKYRPLLNQVFEGFGYPEQYQLEDIFKKTAAIILEAPVIDGPVRLVRPTVRYKFADKDLESLDPLQKQLLRMGPANTRIIQNKTRLLIEAMVNEDTPDINPAN